MVARIDIHSSQERKSALPSKAFNMIDVIIKGNVRDVTPKPLLEATVYPFYASLPDGEGIKVTLLIDYPMTGPDTVGAFINNASKQPFSHTEDAADDIRADYGRIMGRSPQYTSLKNDHSKIFSPGDTTFQKTLQLISPIYSSLFPGRTERDADYSYVDLHFMHVSNIHRILAYAQNRDVKQFEQEVREYQREMQAKNEFFYQLSLVPPELISDDLRRELEQPREFMSSGSRSVIEQIAPLLIKGNSNTDIVIYRRVFTYSRFEENRGSYSTGSKFWQHVASDHFDNHVLPAISYVIDASGNIQMVHEPVDEDVRQKAEQLVAGKYPYASFVADFSGESTLQNGAVNTILGSLALHDLDARFFDRIPESFSVNITQQDGSQVKKTRKNSPVQILGVPTLMSDLYPHSEVFKNMVEVVHQLMAVK